MSKSISPVRKHVFPPTSEEREREREKGKVGRKGAPKRKRLEGASEGVKEGDTGSRIEGETEVTSDKGRGRRETEVRRGCTRTFVQRHAWCLEWLAELEERTRRLVSVMSSISVMTCFSSVDNSDLS